MTWFKIDDSFYDHPKVIALPLAARGLWVTAGTWAAHHLTDGAVPLQVVLSAGNGSRAAMDRLVASGLWERTETGIQFHDWKHYQPTKSEVEAKREFERERKRKYRRRPNGTYAGTDSGTTAGTGRGTPSSPSRPVPSSPPPPPSRTEPDAPAELPATAGDERDNPNGHTPARQLAAALLGTTPDDPRLEHLPTILRTHDVRSPAAWLKTAAANGDLENLLDQARLDADPYPNMPHNPPPPPPGVPMPDHIREELGLTRRRKGNRRHLSDPVTPEPPVGERENVAEALRDRAAEIDPEEGESDE